MTFGSLTPASYHTRQPSTSSNASSFSNYSNASMYSRASTLSSVSSVSSTSTSSRYAKENLNPISPSSPSRSGMVSSYHSSLTNNNHHHLPEHKFDYGGGRSSPRESPRNSPRNSPVKNSPRPLPNPHQMGGYGAATTGSIPRALDFGSPRTLRKAETYAAPGSPGISPFDGSIGEHETEPERPRLLRPTSVILTSSTSSVPVLESDLGALKNSSVSHLRTLSKDSNEFAVAVASRDVVGMSGRKRLTKIKNSGDSWANRDWMDRQRKYMKAYEYLCHIGEAKEWIERCINDAIPPIVQLEEGLRNGIILARLVETFAPELIPRGIFKHEKLQFRHSDNIVGFFRFVAHVGLPDIFIFELTDLYDKKNIPKVIYCIHALSFLLFKLGFTDYSIGNLIGKLEFTEDELMSTQRGLDMAGVSLPSFRGMEKHFDPVPEEPEETEEERIDRELQEVEPEITALQAMAKGCLTRLKLGYMMEDLWNQEQQVIALQSHVRGMFSRSSFAYRADMAAWATELQSLGRGLLVRSHMAQQKRALKRSTPTVAKLQARIRGNASRKCQQRLRSDLTRHTKSVTKFQAAMRGVLLRDSIDRHMDDVVESYEVVVDLQGHIRGAMKRQEIAHDLALLKRETPSITRLQALARGALYRGEANADLDELDSMEDIWTAMQAKVRGHLLRKELAEKRERLVKCLPQIIELQALAQGAIARNKYDDLQDDLDNYICEIEDLQNVCFGYLVRKECNNKNALLRAQESRIIELQALCRGALARGSNMVFVAELHAGCTDEVTGLQACIRAALARREVRFTMESLYDVEPEVVELQSIARAKIARQAYQGKLQHYNENMQKVVKIQSFVRAKQQGEAYKSLMSGKNPPVGTVKNFVHLLNDSNLDFDEEIEFERSRKNVVQHVRANEMAEQYIEQLDIKIGLLIRNKITLDEVIKYQKLGGHSAALINNVDLASADPFDLKALNKNSRRKLELYQMLFFALQTQPNYLVRLFERIRALNTPERDLKRLENLVIGLFGYAQNRREEFYLLKLIRLSITQEMQGCKTPQDFLRGNFFWIKLMVNYIRSPRDRKYLRENVGPFLSERILENEELDLESNPLQIYRSSINNEELRTGQKSHRLPDISQEEAIRDPETRQTFVMHLEDLRDLCDGFMETIEEHAHRMPFGVRFLAQACYHALMQVFPHDDIDGLLQVVIHFIYLKYLHPIVVAPETSGITDRALTPIQKKNLQELDKVLYQVSAGKHFSVKDDIYLQPLNEYLDGAKIRMRNVFKYIVAVPTVEKQFDMDEYDDLTRRTNPTLYIKMADIFALHTLVAREIDYMAPEKEDQIRDLIRELGSVKNSEAELQSVSSTEINLTLNPKLCRIEDPESEVKALLTETKRCILYIIRIQTGSNLMEILVKPVSYEDEQRWKELIDEETSGKKRGAYADASHVLSDLSMLTYSDLKKTALENVLKLEQTGKISRRDNFQDILNSIAMDIRTKHRRRMQRQKEIEGVKQTLSHLDEKSKFLEEKLHSYNDYIEKAMITLQTKKGKKKTVLPFTRQYFHMRELQRSGKIPKFGSYKYSARNLFDKGVLISMEGYNDRQFDKICFTLSSDQVGVFFVEASMGTMMIPGASTQVPLDDLLQAQFNNHQFMQLFEGMVKLNVNLFLHLLFKKFYRDE